MNLAVGKYARALSRPVETGFHLASRASPRTFWRHLDRASRKAGFDRLYFVLSFDCDTKEDAEVVVELDARLRSLGARPSYAVPGELLLKGISAYRVLHERGAEFLNHGHRTHTAWNTSDQRYESTFFYDQQPIEVVKEDIRRGHATVQEALGTAPRGFRTPHFGTFQRGEHLEVLHQTLRELGYRYSSSTTPYFAFSRGPVYQSGGVAEIPVTGVFSRPMEIHDSWRFMGAPGRTCTPADYLAEAEKMADFSRTAGSVGVLNYYCDPSHVHDSPEFFAAVKAWLGVAQPAQLGDVWKLTSGR